ncbi:chemotaxis protein CheB [Sphingobium fuliginis ATCC 27551]|uniref:protein-glutamate methylesterase n=1 Tax=Sphingobium fuliginis ATCC 27551 TaxID=1208342 RepID=A0A5B8CFN6_SPHSA|nr:chemotaxis protein CheB [Sphingobium fuliginis ATCC 27551]
MAGHDIIVVGASTGGVDALVRLVAQLPAGMDAAMLIVLHVGTGVSRLADILNRAGKLPAGQPADGEEILAGHIYVAPPDLHMTLEGGRVRLAHGDKENFSRPAIDPLFRSSAAAYGPRVVGIVLTGKLQDGSAGLLAIKQGGGIAIVQDPAEAVAPSMPQRAIACAPVDHVCPLAEMSALLLHYGRPPDGLNPPLRSTPCAGSSSPLPAPRSYARFPAKLPSSAGPHAPGPVSPHCPASVRTTGCGPDASAPQSPAPAPARHSAPPPVPAA